MKTGIVTLVAGCLLFCGWAVTSYVLNVQFEQRCGGFLKRAADANTIEIAQQELEVAVAYASKEGLTEGYTSILWRTPDEDIAFWFRNISASLRELNEVNPDASKMERTNILMKLRETLLDQKGSSVEVTVPSGISIYPLNALFAIWGWMSLLVIILGGIMIFRSSL